MSPRLMTWLAVWATLLGLLAITAGARAERLTQHEVQRAVRHHAHAWDTPHRIRGVRWLKPRVARVAVRWWFGDIIIEDEEGRTVTPMWFPEWVTVKDRGRAGVWLWSPVLGEWSR